MTRISSSFTFVLKRVFPFFWFGFIAIFLVVAALNPAFEGASIVVATAVLMGAIGYFVFRKLVWDVVDAVYDGGDFLLVRNRGEEERIPLSRIARVGEWLWMNPPRVTLELSTPGKFGDKIVFLPKLEFGLPLARYAITQKLTERIKS